MASEIQIDILTEGTGDTAETGKTVSVHYEGQLLDGSVFDASRPRGQAFRFTIGAGQVIPGWEQGNWHESPGKSADHPARTCLWIIRGR